MVEQSQEAWEAVDGQYRNQVRRWVLHHPRLHMFDEDPDVFVNMAFEKFWKRNFSAVEFAGFPNIRSILAYLKTCVASVITDHGRNQSRMAEVVYLDEMLIQAHPQALTYHDRGDDGLVVDEFWLKIREILGDDGMYVTLYCSFVQGLRPVEIFQQFPQLFKDVREVYKLKARAMVLLEQNAHQMNLFFHSPRGRE
ncbi:MAG TPA: hypothetical protein PK530_06805 [Anaerolineales bacterium]|nr:hypothetical protein [Anaerolineales bacterium]